jgi:hypothetical protein
MLIIFALFATIYRFVSALRYLFAVASDTFFIIVTMFIIFAFFTTVYGFVSARWFFFLFTVRIYFAFTCSRSLDDFALFI